MNDKDRPAQMPHPLPIDDVLPALLSALASGTRAVLQAPPGAGKTTRVPLALLEAGLYTGKLLMLEPRRLAARAAAERMAETLGEPVGGRVGYRIRGEAKSGKATRIEVVTEGILTRMVQSDPELSGIGAILFDEFHERSIHADLGLALSLEVAEALRPDLRLLVMSATLDAAPVAALLGDAPLITSQGRAFPVDTRYLDHPWSQPTGRTRFDAALADLILTAHAADEGDLLAFLPGEGEIRRVAARLSGALPEATRVHPLFGAMPFKDQRAAIRPAETGRKIVLATAIAETSLTIEGVRIVVDGGQARRARFDSASAMSRLVTERVTRAEAEQRRGRAGRVAPGVCYRLWTKGEDGALAAFPPPEILAADIAPLVLECALWGATDPAALPFLTPPNPVAVAEAQALLRDLGALDETAAITVHGKALARLPLHPRLGHMVLSGGPDAPLLAALLSERDIVQRDTGSVSADLTLRLDALKNPTRFESEHSLKVNRAVRNRVKDEARRIPPANEAALSVGGHLALAYPDRVGLRRNGDQPRYLLSGGKGGIFDAAEPMGNQRLIVACDLDGDGTEAKIRMAAPLSEAELRHIHAGGITRRHQCRWSRRNRSVEAVEEECFGALVLSSRAWTDCPDAQVTRALVDGLRQLGPAQLRFGKSARLLRARIEWLRKAGAEMPDCSDDGLMQALENWLQPHLKPVRRLGDIPEAVFDTGLRGRLDWGMQQTLDHAAPAYFTAPTGTRLAIDYGGAAPSVSVRLQEMFGLNRHPVIGPNHLPLVIELLSPAGRPLQVTADLPGFWATSYGDVRKDMRGRYPKHPWPENPAEAVPTRRAKPRK